jgi:bla regulator protein blaR1
MDQLRQLGWVRTLLMAVLTSAAAAAQVGTVALPAFDVVSIKPHQDEGISRMGIRFNATPDGLSFNGGSLDMLLHLAFDVPRDRLLNEPGWVRSSRFDVEAKVAPEDATRLQTLTRQQRWAMLIPALEDRCRLKFHYEKRNLQVYTLGVARDGPKLKEANPADSDAAKPTSTDRAQEAQLPMMWISQKGMNIKAHDATIESLIQMLSQQLGTTMLDNTGLAGKYDYTLSWMPDEASWQLMGLAIPGPPPGTGGQSQQTAGPSIFTALQEQLGLKAQARKAPVDVVVIDHIEPPSAN